ncbi:hypothetical protein [Bacillus infantis]|uniref:hypothetical protein n=1 Tax=Bacillus infantis TaxID=324767 RepID=UPI003CF8EDEE
MAKKRSLRNPKEIREMIEESGMKFVMLNNRLFDDFYSVGKVEYKPVLKQVKKEEKNNKEREGIIEYWEDYKGAKTLYKDNNNKVCSATFDERDFILIIFLKFLSQHNFQGYTQEVADYLFPSEKGQNNKRIKKRIKKLRYLQGVVNNEYNHKSQKRAMFENGAKVRLINEEKVIGYENGTSKRTFYKWHLNFDCDYKREVKEVNGNKSEVETPINFFKVTIYDLDLFTSGVLNEKEFIAYLYFIRSFNEGKQIWHSIDALSEKLNIKDSRITEKIVERLSSLRVKDKFCEEGQDFPLIHIDKPSNYERRIMDRMQPSAYYKPVYNTHTCKRLGEPETVAKVEGDTPQEDVAEAERRKRRTETWGFDPDELTAPEEDDLSCLDELE